MTQDSTPLHPRALGVIAALLLGGCIENEVNGQRVPAALVAIEPTFHGVYEGCDEVSTLTLKNPSTTDHLDVLSLASSVTDFTVGHECEGLRLEPESEAACAVTFSPERPVSFDADDEDGATITVSWRAQGDTSAQATIVGLSAQALPAPDRAREDRFDTPSGEPLDMVVIVDQSGSLTEEVAGAMGFFEDFVATLSARTDDWSLWVANASDGCATTPALGPETEDAAQIFFDAATSYDTSKGSTYIVNPEALLLIADLALTDDTGDLLCNDGLLREDAMLVLQLFTDEPEQSGDAEAHAAAILSSKEDPDQIKVNVVGVEAYATCGAAERYDATCAYLSITEDSGGRFVTFDEGWMEAILSDLVEDAEVLSTLPLSEPPEEIEAASVAVSAVDQDGEVIDVSGDWSYDADRAEVTFENGAPAGASITVRYAVALDCSAR